jgi:hypothetical protein
MNEKYNSGYKGPSFTKHLKQKTLSNGNKIKKMVEKSKEYIPEIYEYS